MEIKRNLKGELNMFELNNKLTEKERVDLLYWTLVGLYEFDSEHMCFEKYIEFVQSEVRELLTHEIIG